MLHIESGVVLEISHEGDSYVVLYHTKCGRFVWRVLKMQNWEQADCRECLDELSDLEKEQYKGA